MGLYQGLRQADVLNRVAEFRPRTGIVGMWPTSPGEKSHIPIFRRIARERFPQLLDHSHRLCLAFISAYVTAPIADFISFEVLFDML
jgi:hypothetical protein